MRWFGSVPLVALLLMPSCVGPWDTVAFEDEGELCFAERGGGVSIEVTAPGCLSSSCSRDVAAECSATLEGTRIEVTSSISWEEKQRGTCTLDCGIAMASCGLDALPAGTYTVVHGEDEVELTVPVVASCPL